MTEDPNKEFKIGDKVKFKDNRCKVIFQITRIDKTTYRSGKPYAYVSGKVIQPDYTRGYQPNEFYELPIGSFEKAQQ